MSWNNIIPIDTPTSNRPIPLAGSYTVLIDDATKMPTILTRPRLFVFIQSIPSNIPQIATRDKSPSVAWNGCRTALNGLSVKLHILESKVSKQNRLPGGISSINTRI